MVALGFLTADAVGVIGTQWGIVTVPQQFVCQDSQANIGWSSDRPGNSSPMHNLSGAVMINESGRQIKASFNSTRYRNSAVFDGVGHDNILRRDDNTTYLLSQYSCVHLYISNKTRIPTNKNDWQFVDNGIQYPTKSSGNSVDTMIRVNGTWYAYTGDDGGNVFTSRSLTGNWNKHSTNKKLNDIGVIYENDTFHAFYEYNPSGLSGEKIGHATSPNGITNWTFHQPVYNSTDGYKTGDYEVIKHDGVYFMLADYTREHPNYRIAVFASSSLSRNFTHIGFAARPFVNDSIEPEQGIQDPTVLYDSTRESYVGYAHAHESKRRAHWFIFNPKVNLSTG
jgi:hypothetical protein